MKITTYHQLKEAAPSRIRAKGHLQEFLKRQTEGLGGHYTEMKYPFDTCLWEGKMENMHFTEGVYNGSSRPVPDVSVAWWPYEQAGYLLDGMIRLALLTDNKELEAKYQKSLDYVVSHPDSDGLLGHCFHSSTSEWPLTVFFRSVMAFCAEHPERKDVLAAFTEHYRRISEDLLSEPDNGRNMTNLEGMLKCYEWSGDRELLEKAIRIYEMFDSRNVETSDRNSNLFYSVLTSGQIAMHGVSFMEMLKIPVILYLYSGDRKWLDAARKCLDRAIADHEQPGGHVSCNEFLSGRDPQQGFETCVTSDMMWTLGYFVMAEASVKDADRMERLAYNALPGAITKDFTALQYCSSVNQVVADPFCNHSHYAYGETTWRQYRPDQFPQCCPGNLQRIMPNYVLRMWMSTPDGAPVAVLHGPSQFSFEWNGSKYTVTAETEYPYAEKIVYRFHAEGAASEFPFAFRIPCWCPKASYAVNGGAAVACKCGTFASEKRIWNDGDTLELTLPMQVVLREDRQWKWLDYGAITFAYAVPQEIIREKPSRFSPLRIYPTGDWNYALDLTPEEASKLVPRKQKSDYPLDTPPLVLDVPVRQISGYDSLLHDRYTPSVPLYHRLISERRTIQLQPYGGTLLRITAFADTATRRSLGIVHAYVSNAYPYDCRRPLRDQVFPPEFWTTAEFAQKESLQRDTNQVFDIAKSLGSDRNRLAYLAFRIWADEDAEATFVLAPASCAQCFIDGKEVFSLEGNYDAQLMEGHWFRHAVHKGYNYLIVKVGFAPYLPQYRADWSCKLDVFVEK